MVNTTTEAIDITERNVILVEGYDDQALVAKLIETQISTQFSEDTRVIDAEGVQKFTALMPFVKDKIDEGIVKSLGVVRDADSDPSAAVEFIGNILDQNGLMDTNVEHAQFEIIGTIKVGAYILPSGSCEGAIETLCKNAIGDDPATACVDEFIRCLEMTDALESTHKDKTFIRAYLAAKHPPMDRVGHAAEKNHWDFTHDAFAEFKEFLTDLLS